MKKGTIFVPLITKGVKSELARQYTDIHSSLSAGRWILIGHKVPHRFHAPKFEELLGELIIPYNLKHTNVKNMSTIFVLLKTQDVKSELAGSIQLYLDVCIHTPNIELSHLTCFLQYEQDLRWVQYTTLSAYMYVFSIFLNYACTVI